MLLSILPTILTTDTSNTSTTTSTYEDIKDIDRLLLKSMIKITRIFNDFYSCTYLQFKQILNKGTNTLLIEHYFIDHHINDYDDIVLVKFYPNDYELKLTDKKNQRTFTRRKRIQKSVKSVHLNKNIKTKCNTQMRFLDILIEFFQEEWKKYNEKNKGPAKTKEELKQEENDEKEKIKKEKKEYKAAKKGKTKDEKKKFKNEIKQKKADEHEAITRERKEKADALLKNFLDSHFVVKQLINFITNNDKHNVLSTINPYHLLSIVLEVQHNSNIDLETKSFTFRKLNQMILSKMSMQIYLDKLFITKENKELKNNSDTNSQSSQPCIFAIYCVNTFHNTHDRISNYFYYSDGKIYTNKYMDKAIGKGYSKTIKKVEATKEFQLKEMMDISKKEVIKSEKEITEGETEDKKEEDKKQVTEGEEKKSYCKAPT